MDKEVKRLARWIARKWSCPTWFSVEDIQQEILIGMEIERRRGRDEKIVLFAAVNRAKRAAHRARGVRTHVDPDRRQSRHDVPVKRADLSDMQVCTQVDPVELNEMSERIRQIRALGWQDDRTRLMFEALMEEGAVELAAAKLYRDPATRLVCRFSNERGAVKAVARVLRLAAERIERTALAPQRNAA